MELTKYQEVLIYFLKMQNLKEAEFLAISLMLWKSVDGIKAFIYLCHKDQVEQAEEMVMLARAIVEYLPPEERTGEVMNLRMKL